MKIKYFKSRLFKKSTIALSIALALCTQATAQLNARFSGTEPGEIITYTTWYEYQYYLYYLNFLRFTEHGKNIEIIYSFDPGSQYINPDAIPVGIIVPDCTPGVLYNFDLHGMGYLFEGPDLMYLSQDHGHTWTSLGNDSDTWIWTFANEPNVLLKNVNNNMFISNDNGFHFDALDVPSIGWTCNMGWNIGEYFKWTYANHYHGLVHYEDFYSHDTTRIDESFFSEAAMFSCIGPEKGEFYLAQYLDDNSLTINHSSNYGENMRTMSVIDSSKIHIDEMSRGMREFLVDREPGVCYVLSSECLWATPENGTEMKVLFFRDYGQELVTTYFHHFAPDWYSHHTPVMDLEMVGFDVNSVSLSWTEPELKPNENLIGYIVFRNNEPLFDEPITTNYFTDNYTQIDDLQYHVLAVYDDGTSSKSYNIIYCHKTLGVDVNNANEITVYPNPTKNNLSIHGTALNRIEVYDTLGQLVLLQSIHSTDDLYTLNISELTPGLYVIKANQQDGSQIVHQIIKQ